MRLAAALWALFILAGPAAAQPEGPWPGGRQAAITLTYDDAIQSHLDIAIPQLDQANLKGTFFLIGRDVGDNIDRWRAVAASGHELGNHAINHPCRAGAFDMPVPYNLENYTVETMLNEVRTMNTMLRAIDGKTAHAYATPCGDNLAGGEDYVAPLQQSGISTHIRDVRALPQLPADAPPITGIGFVGTSGADMIAWVEGVQRSGGLGIVVFHGVGGDHLSVSGEAHGELVAYLKAHEDEIWVARYSEAMDHVAAHAAH